MDFEVTNDGITVFAAVEVSFWVETFKIRFSPSAVLEMVNHSPSHLHKDRVTEMDFEVTDDGTTVFMAAKVRFRVEKFKVRFSSSIVLEMVDHPLNPGVIC
jgi:hypothetical protein